MINISGDLEITNEELIDIIRNGQYDDKIEEILRDYFMKENGFTVKYVYFNGDKIGIGLTNHPQSEE